MRTSERAVYDDLSELLRDARRSTTIALEPYQLIMFEAAQGARTNGKSSERRGTKR